jgi:hypothetical protein
MPFSAVVESYFMCSLHLKWPVFGRTSLQRKTQEIMADSTKADICCLAAVVAVGMQYNLNEAEVSANQAATCYDIARYYFETLLETRPLDAIKVYVLMAMFNIFSKATVALAYVGKSWGMIGG